MIDNTLQNERGYVFHCDQTSLNTFIHYILGKPDLTHLSLLPQICASDSVSNSAPSYYLNKCWVIVNWTLNNKLQWHFSRNTNFSFSFQKIHLKISFAKWRPFCLGWWVEIDRLTPMIYSIAANETQPILSNWFSSNVERITTDNHVKQAGVYAGTGNWLSGISPPGV